MHASYPIWILLVFGFFFSCGKGPSETQDKNYIIHKLEIEDVPEPDLLRGNKLNLSVLLDPESILWTGKYLVVGESKTLDYYLHVIDPESETLIKTMGKDVFGPGEISTAYQLEKGKSVNEIWVYDHTQKLIALFDLESPDELYQKAFRQPQNMYLATDIRWFSDDKLICRLADGDDKYVLYDTLGNQLTTYGTWSQLIADPSLPPNVIKSVHQGRTSFNPAQKKYVLGGRFRDFIEILDLSSGEIISTRGPEHVIPAFVVDYSAGYPMAQFTDRSLSSYYMDIIAGDEYIYALYFGKSADLYYKNGELSKEIFVFDYDGKLVKTYTLDYSLVSLAVDEENRRFFGISSDEDPNVVVFDF
ncbi:TolB-like 6-blade propeller-like [Cyclobacterium lianum]|uniref:TolB-like 6-blade propeller-like n=1 Tax=Cyclobacterium lianum TaxID=388280 RepID=A0A1M7K1D3_9BACT|nr:TolB-like 6-blade propeller-like [Cyclobacterium lianum]